MRRFPVALQGMHTTAVHAQERSGACSGFLCSNVHTQPRHLTCNRPSHSADRQVRVSVSCHKVSCQMHCTKPPHQATISTCSESRCNNGAGPHLIPGGQWPARLSQHVGTVLSIGSGEVLHRRRHPHQRRQLCLQYHQPLV